MPAFPTQPSPRREKFAGAAFPQHSRLLCPSQQHDSFPGTEAEGESGGLMGSPYGGRGSTWPLRYTPGLGDKRGLCTSVDLLLPGPLRILICSLSVHAGASFTFLPGHLRNVPSAHQHSTHTHGVCSPSPVRCYCHS